MFKQQHFPRAMFHGRMQRSVLSYQSYLYRGKHHLCHLHTRKISVNVCGTHLRHLSSLSRNTVGRGYLDGGSSDNSSRRFFTTSRSNETQSISDIPRSVRIGHVELPLKHGDPQHRYRVPHGYLPKNPSKTMLKHLQWMMAKDNLKQDMLLVGPPGAGAIHRRRLAMMYAEMTHQQVEILTLSSDVTESDLKQRRELISPTAGQGARVEFVDQPPVRAALRGSLLILDGLDKAERNVLPTLNNLLENREMNLEDGRFLVSPERYAELSTGGILEESSSFLVPAHANFRVIALAVPSPPYDVGSLDPPLRSRFQIRRINNDTTDETFEALVQNEMSEDSARVCSLLCGAMEDAAHDASSGTRTLHFPLNAAHSISNIMDNFPLEPPKSVISRAFPYGSNETRMQMFLAKRHGQSQEAFDRACQEFKLVSDASNTLYEIEKISSIPGDKFRANVSFSAPPASLFSTDTSENNVTVAVPCGGNALHQISKEFVETVGSKSALSAMVQEHFAGRDILLTSPKGEGKSATATEFSSMLGYDVHLFSLYKEMTGRDLLMRRTTDAETGETGWDESPLLTAAKKGQVCVLDGIEKLSSDTLGTLHGFLTDREVCLPDGRKIAAIQRQENPDDQSVDNVHPSFRAVALSSFSNETGASWITEELVSMFSIIPLDAPSRDCLKDILMTITASAGVQNENGIDKILDFNESLSEEVAADCGVSPLSTRNLIRLAKAGERDLHARIWSVLVADLVPPRQRSVLDSLLQESGILPQKQSTRGTPPLAIKMDHDELTIGDFTMERLPVSRPEMVPSPYFFDIPNHVWMIKTLLEERALGERAFLLLGNQGVGKNKVVDRLCELANFEREYIQLHRDSSISSLTLSPTIEDGKIIWKDSPLVRAVTKGCSLIIDEADKAPLEVISVLKSLVQDGELLLADGRRISRKSRLAETIRIHPDFTVFVLANRPGFPFHGNDFFGEIGDCFSSHIIPNPDLQSEINLLRSYAPSVDESVLRRIAASFSDLRHLFEHGDITYPYSTREAVSVVKHLEQYPNENIVTVLHNVLDMDSFNGKLYSRLAEVFREHGFPIKFHSWKKSTTDGDGESDDFLGIEYLTDRSKEGTSATPPSLSEAKFGKWDENNDPHVGGNQWAGGTGGSDTAGLGGRGGPFRLDRGHKVHQVSDEAKAQVSKEAAAAARKMAQTALKERLKEIGMSGAEFQMYKEFISPIDGDIASLRATLQSAEFKSSERDWIKRQSYGEIDDSKLVEGVAGEKYIYKRRGTVENQRSHSVKRPRRIRFVMDCSGSMYRFNGYDQRQQRCLEAAALVMEAFDGMEKRFDYSIVGHSGDSRCIKLVNFGEPPTNEKERMQILQTMVAHSQYCQSGDNTLGAIKQAVVDVTKGYAVDGETDENCMVIAVSDANLARYGISPRELARAMTDGSSDSKAGMQTKAYCVFIASFGSEADNIKKELPRGRGFVCMQTNELPKIVKHILTSEIA